MTRKMVEKNDDGNFTATYRDQSTQGDTEIAALERLVKMFYMKWVYVQAKMANKTPEELEAEMDTQESK